MKQLQEGLTKGYLAFLEHFSYKLNSKINQSLLSGQRKSGAKGSSMEFSDFREYTLGDDIRRIDWNSFARNDKLYTKIFLEEKQAEINVFIDTSRSLNIDEEKCFYAKMLAASIVYISLKNNDRVNIYSWNEGLKESRINNNSKNNFPSVVSFLNSLVFDGKSNLKKTVESAVYRGRRGVSFIISDMFIEDDIEEIIKSLRYKKQEIILVQVLSKSEVDPELAGSLRLTDCETGLFKDVTITEGLIEEYKKALSLMKVAIHDSCRKNGGKFIALDTSVDIKEAIKLIF